MKETPSERTEIPEHDLAKMRPPPLKINGLHHNFFVMGWLWTIFLIRFSRILAFGEISFAFMAQRINPFILFVNMVLLINDK
jgi:hypothetical protein